MTNKTNKEIKPIPLVDYTTDKVPSGWVLIVLDDEKMYWCPPPPLTRE